MDECTSGVLNFSQNEVSMGTIFYFLKEIN